MRAKTPFREWIRRTRRCVSCGTGGPDPHHLKTIGMGGTRDHEAADADNVVPLCRTCHDLVHRGLLGTPVGTLYGRPVYAVKGRTLQAWASDTWSAWLHLDDEDRKWWEEFHDGGTLAS